MNMVLTSLQEKTQELFFPSGATAQLRLRPPHCYGFYITHTHTHTHTPPVGLHQTSDQLVSEAATYTTHNQNKTQTTVSPAGFEAVNPAIKLLHICAPNRTATGIG